MPGPLDGVKVVELAVWVAGPAAGGIMADWGADVVKIEPPTGDPARQYQRMLGGDLPTNPVFELDNRSKRSVAIDLRTDAGRDIAFALFEQADVFVTNVRAAALKRLGIDYDAVRARAPRLVYALITGYGLTGPDADEPAYDIGAFWSRSGMADLLSPEGGEPPFQRGGMGDHSVGMTTVAAINAALLARQRTGEGQLVSTSLLRQGAYTIGFDLNLKLMWGNQLQLGRRTSMRNPAMNHYVAGDGQRFWIIGQEAARHWPSLARAVGRPEWIEEYPYPRDRAEHAVEIIAELDRIFATKSRDEWAAIFATEPEFFWAPVNTLDDLLADPQFFAGGGTVDVPDGGSTTTMLSTPADFSSTRWAPRAVAPRLGEHTADVLRELGRSDDDIAALVDAGAVALDADGDGGNR
jgi:crotonobetainyl-CoA:carnitine CoA-transferase CaiB-like acyl-CoA transferase